jgi:hypothetical protein
MRILRIATGLLALFCSALSCASVEDARHGIEALSQPVTAEWVETSSRVSRDDYRQSLSIQGPAFRDSQRPRGAYTIAHLQGVVSRNDAESFQLYVAARLLGQWHNLQVAHDRDGIAFEVHKVSRNKQCDADGDCAFYEHVAVAMSREFLKARTAEDVELILDGPGGEIEVRIPMQQTAGFLSRFDKEAAAMRNAPSGSPQRAEVSYCEAKYSDDLRALSFCQKEARASYERLVPIIERSRSDTFTRESKVLEGCMRRHNGHRGIDWMMVEHCVSKRSSRGTAGGPASSRN